MEQFRYDNFGQDEEDFQNGPLFYSDLFAVMEQRRLNPSNIIIISLEENFNREVQAFWSNTRVLEMLMNRAQVIRISRTRQADTYNQFTQLFPVQARPSLFVFGPNSVGPSFSYAGNFPDVDEFEARFMSFTFSQPVNIQIAPPSQRTPDINIDDMPRNRSHPRPQRPTSANQITIEREEPPPRQASEPPRRNLSPQNISNAIPPVQSPPQQQNRDQVNQNQARSQQRVAVRVEQPNNAVIVRGFKSNESVLAIFNWVSHIIGQPHTHYELRIQPNNELLPLNDRVLISTYAPELNLKLILKKNPSVPMPNIFKSIWNYFLYALDMISPFADLDDDPNDFWHVEPPVPRSRRPQPQRVNQNQNRNRVNQEGNVRRFNFRDNDDNQGYNNGNNTAFNQ